MALTRRWEYESEAESSSSLVAEEGVEVVDVVVEGGMAAAEVEEEEEEAAFMRSVRKHESRSVDAVHRPRAAAVRRCYPPYCLFSRALDAIRPHSKRPNPAAIY